MTDVKVETNQNPQVIFSWVAPLRAYKKRSTGVLRFYIALALLLSLIVVFFGDKILVMPILAIIFLFYVLTITPPPSVTNKITKFGVETAGNAYRFDFLSYFYFVEKFDYHVLVLVSHEPYSYHIYLVIKDIDIKQKVTKLLSDYLIYQEHPHKTLTDKMTEWLTKLMPSEKDFIQEVKPVSAGKEPMKSL